MLPHPHVLIATAWLLAASAALADDQPAASPATTGPDHDKSGYNLFHPTPAAQMRDMAPDRPNVTNSPQTIDAGHMQVEIALADFTHFHDRSAGNDVRTDTWSLGRFNIRAGILNDLEFNVAVTPFQFQYSYDVLSGQTSRANGIGDTVVGGKFNVWGNDGADAVGATALAIQPQVKLPTANRALGNGRVEAQVNVPLMVNLPAGFHLGLMTTPLLERNSDNTGYCAGWINSVSVDRVVFKKLDCFVEYASHLTTERHREAQGSVDIGALYQLSRNISLDTAVNLGVNRATPAFEWVVGLTFRL